MIQHATINGRSHRITQQNSHDFALSGSVGQGMYYGLVLDGCGSKPSHNEVGAKLLGQFAASHLQGALAALTDHSPVGVTAVLDTLYPHCLQFLQQTTALFPWQSAAERAAFISTHWLATLLGFVVTPQTAVFFWQGDGYLVHNGHVITLDSSNRPNYLAYHLLEEVAPSADAFQTLVVERPSLQWLAVATDGWQPDLLQQLGEPRPGLQLARWINVQARQHGRFEDDGAAAVWLKIIS